MKLDPSRIIDTSTLSNVISIDRSKGVAIVEPNVPMDSFVQETIQHGFVPAVVPEFPGITVGGSYSGTAAESSSFKFGYFDRTVNWVEVVLPNGSITRASPTENPDLFYGAAGAMGTLGVTTLFEIQLVASDTYVETTYLPITSITDALGTLKRCGSDGSVSYLDAILFSAYSGVVVVGRLSSSASPDEKETSVLPVARFSRAKDPWFYLHAHNKVEHPLNTHCIVCLWNNEISSPKDPPMVELVPLYDYFFRYDRGSFWMGSYGWGSLPLPFNRFGRWALDRLFRTRTMYKAMHHSGQSQRFVIQDLAIPEEKALQFLDFVDKDLQIYPLWLCPIRGDSGVSLHTTKNYTSISAEDAALGCVAEKTPRTLINVGVWGIPQLGKKIYNANNFHEFIGINRDIERVVRELGGLKWLYAHNYYTEDEFWQTYDKEKYDALRERWNASGLPSIWDKVKREKEGWQPVNMPKAILLLMLGKDHLLGKK